MKRKYMLSTLTVLTLLMSSGCNESESASSKDTSATQNAAVEKDGDTIEVDKGLLNVEVTIPADFFEEQDKATIVADAKEKGMQDVKVNADGSVTYKMSRVQHKKLLKEMKKEIEASIQNIPTDAPSIQKVAYNRDFSKYEITVDKKAYMDSFDGFAVLGLGMLSAYYAAFNGSNTEDFKIVFDMYDANTGEIYDTVTLPDDWKEGGDTESP